MVLKVAVLSVLSDHAADSFVFPYIVGLKLDSFQDYELATIHTYNSVFFNNHTANVLNLELSTSITDLRINDIQL